MGNLLFNMVMNICARRWRHPRRSGHEHFLEQVNFITILKSRLYGYQHFLEQVNLAEQLNSSDFGNYWKNSKWYCVNVERGNAADNSNGRKFNVSFTNTSNVPIEVMLFIFYSDEISIDVKTGLVTRHKN